MIGYLSWVELGDLEPEPCGNIGTTDQQTSATNMPSPVVEINKQQLSDLLTAHTGPEFCLLEFYAPWCPHCHAFVPEYERVAQEVKSRFGDQVTVARYNGSDNPIPTAFDIQYFPSFYVVGTKLEHPIPYDGQRSVKGLVSFLDHILQLAAHNPTRRQRYSRAV